ESISLHRGELPGGDKPRSLIVHDMRHSAIQLQQIEGRCHRDGQRAVIYYAFAEDTVEERIAATVVTRMVAMDGMAGDDTSLVDEIARVIVESVAPTSETQHDANSSSADAVRFTSL
ncbi:MAG: type restriction protein res subunit, partial [Thermomicrobiales bacterium]|nr:type restriction protein res subunit [Thermomicrobiales bacterium]